MTFRLSDFVTLNDYDSSITEVEESILKAIYWIGEAQNEFDLDIAFIKYWTAIECMFNQKMETTKSLVRGVTISMIFSGYQDIQDANNIDDAKLIYKEIEKLYNKRSLIIHQGKTHLTKQVIDEYDISAICKYTAWSISQMFYLRSIGYVTRDQIKIQTDRLSSILKLETNPLTNIQFFVVRAFFLLTVKKGQDTRKWGNLFLGIFNLPIFMHSRNYF